MFFGEEIGEREVILTEGRAWGWGNWGTPGGGGAVGHLVRRVVVHGDGVAFLLCGVIRTCSMTVGS